jgi:hypothetical protein
MGTAVKDPEWAPPEKPEKGGGGILGGGGNDTSKEPPRPPAELRRAWSQHVKKAALAHGDRALPQDNLLFFLRRQGEQHSFAGTNLRRSRRQGHARSASLSRSETAAARWPASPVPG